MLAKHDRALANTDALTADEIGWRPSKNSSAIGWHLDHQPAVAHYMIRSLTADESCLYPDLEALMDSAVSETRRGWPAAPRTIL